MLTIDPSDRNAQGAGWDHIMKVTLRRMQPPLVSKALAGLSEMAVGGFIRAHLLGGYNQVEGDRKVAPCAGQEVVIDVRQNAQAIPRRHEALQGRVGVGKRRPAGEAFCQKVRALSTQRPSEALSHPLRSLGQDVTIATVGCGFDT